MIIVQVLGRSFTFDFKDPLDQEFLAKVQGMIRHIMLCIDIRNPKAYVKLKKEQYNHGGHII
jgi:hypothetical protein